MWTRPAWTAVASSLWNDAANSTSEQHGTFVKNDALCNNKCFFAKNGVCEDGGAGSAAGVECAFGSDCTDCGLRVDGQPHNTGTSSPHAADAVGASSPPESPAPPFALCDDSCY
jgi:hypothetical protein